MLHAVADETEARLPLAAARALLARSVGPADGLGERALRGELADPSADQVVHALWWRDRRRCAEPHGPLTLAARRRAVGGPADRGAAAPRRPARGGRAAGADRRRAAGNGARARSARSSGWSRRRSRAAGAARAARAARDAAWEATRGNPLYLTELARSDAAPPPQLVRLIEDRLRGCRPRPRRVARARRDPRPRRQRRPRARAGRARSHRGRRGGAAPRAARGGLRVRAPARRRGGPREHRARRRPPTCTPAPRPCSTTRRASRSTSCTRRRAARRTSSRRCAARPPRPGAVGAPDARRAAARARARRAAGGRDASDAVAFELGRARLEATGDDAPLARIAPRHTDAARHLARHYALSAGPPTRSPSCTPRPHRTRRRGSSCSRRRPSRRPRSPAAASGASRLAARAAPPDARASPPAARASGRAAAAAAVLRPRPRPTARPAAPPAAAADPAPPVPPAPSPPRTPPSGSSSSPRASPPARLPDDPVEAARRLLALRLHRDFPASYAVGELTFSAAALLINGDALDDAERAMDALRDDATAAGQPTTLAGTHWQQAQIAFQRGDLARCETEARAAIEIGGDVLRPLADPWRALARVEQGELDAAEALIPDTIGPSGLLNVAIGVRGRLRLARGDLPRAIEDLAEARDRSAAYYPLRVEPPWQPLLVEALVLAGREAEAAKEVEAFVLAVAHWNTPRAHGQLARLRALLAPREQAIALLEQAVEHFATAPLERARALVELGARQGAAGERTDGAGDAAGGVRRRPRVRRDRAGAARPGRAPARRRPAADAGGRRAHAGRAPCRRPGGRRSDQPRDRAAAVPLAQDDRDAPAQRLPEAGHRRARRARSRVRYRVSARR